MTINPTDVQIYLYNTGSSWFPNLTGVTLRHKPTGLEASCGTERSFHKNRDIAWKELQLKVDAFKPIEIQQMNPTMMIQTLRELADLLESKHYEYKSGGILLREHYASKEIEITSDLVLKEIK